MIPAFQLEDVTAGYGRDPVLRRLSLAVAPGEKVALLGPNGAGKSTLLRVVTGLLKPRAGSVRLDGVDVRGMPPAQRARRVAVVPQELTTPMAFTVEEMVLMGRTATLPRWQRPAAAEWEAVERAMDEADVSALRARFFMELSGGEKQRVALALALAQEPQTILLDEPTSHLDLHHKFDIMRLIERLNRDKGITVLMVSHDANLAAEVCGRIVLLHRGEIVADGPPRAVLREDILQKVYPCRWRVKEDPEDHTLSIRPAP